MTCLITRRSMFMGAAASLICAPSIVKASSLMPIRRVIIEANAFGPKQPIYLGFVGSSERRARNYVAYVEYHGTVLPPGAIVLDFSHAGDQSHCCNRRVSSLGNLNRAAR